MRVPALKSILPSVWVRPLIVLMAANGLRTLKRRIGPRRSRISSRQRDEAVAELRRLVPPPVPSAVGGEKFDTQTYCRFLSVAGWSPEKAAGKLEKDIEWRRKYKPRLLRPSDMPILCRQKSWQVLMQPRPAYLSWRGASGTAHSSSGAAGSGASGALSRFRSRLGNSSSSALLWNARPPLIPPHNRPPMQHWRYTRQGMPITYFTCWDWRPDKAKRDERIRCVAYHMEHYIRRMPNPRVQRVCLIMDMRGFKASMLPNVHDCVCVLRNHYPGRAGAMCFINVPGYFHPLWRIISPWLDEEILSKTFFAPGSVDDAEKAIKWIDRKNLIVGPA